MAMLDSPENSSDLSNTSEATVVSEYPGASHETSQRNGRMMRSASKSFDEKPQMKKERIADRMAEMPHTYDNVCLNEDKFPSKPKFMESLRHKSAARQAFIYSEIFKRKYE